MVTKTSFFADIRIALRLNEVTLPDADLDVLCRKTFDYLSERSVSRFTKTGVVTKETPLPVDFTTLGVKSIDNVKFPDGTDAFEVQIASQEIGYYVVNERLYVNFPEGADSFIYTGYLSLIHAGEGDIERILNGSYNLIFDALIYQIRIWQECDEVTLTKAEAAFEKSLALSKDPTSTSYVEDK